jgi:hypothetical protein
MTPDTNPERYKNHRFPPEITSQAVWLYFRFTLSYRDVEERSGCKFYVPLMGCPRRALKYTVPDTTQPFCAYPF